MIKHFSATAALNFAKSLDFEPVMLLKLCCDDFSLIFLNCTPTKRIVTYFLKNKKKGKLTLPTLKIIGITAVRAKHGINKMRCQSCLVAK